MTAYFSVMRFLREQSQQPKSYFSKLAVQFIM